MFIPLIMGKQEGWYKHIMMAMLDSGNLLQQPAINAGFHRSLGIKIDKTNVVARGANQISIDIEGISKGIYLKFRNLNTSFLIRPLVVKNLASPLNLGSKFNFEFMLTPQMVERDEKTGLKHNQYKIQGKKGKLFSRLAPVSFIKPYLRDDTMFMKILDRWPSEGRIGQHTLAESRRKWGLNSIMTIGSVETSKSYKETDETLQTLNRQGTPSKGSSHLTPTDIGKTTTSTIHGRRSKQGAPGQDSIDRVMKLARITGSAQYYAPLDPSKGLE